MKKRSLMLVLLSVIVCAALGLGACDEATESSLEGEASFAKKGSAGSIGTPDSFLDTFTKGVNVGDWYVGSPTTHYSSGGNPGGYLGATDYVPAPPMYTQGDSVFTGDYTAKMVEGLGVDLLLDDWTVTSPLGREVHLVLTNDSGTPDDPSDDKAVWFPSGSDVPAEGGGWDRYYVPVDYDSYGLPAGAIAYQAGYVYTSGLAADTIWNAVVQDVTRVGWSWGYPLTPSLFSDKTYGMDNALIEFDAK